MERLSALTVERLTDLSARLFSTTPTVAAVGPIGTLAPYEAIRDSLARRPRHVRANSRSDAPNAAMFALPFFRRDMPALKGERVSLRMPVARDYREWAALRGESRAFLEPWEPRWAPDELDRAAWRQRLSRYREDFAQGTAVAFFIFETSSGQACSAASRSATSATASRNRRISATGSASATPAKG